MSDVFRVATCNLQSGVGTTRGYWHYFLTGWKYFLPHGSGPVRRAAAFLASEAVDFAAICEVEGGSWRTRGVDQTRLVVERTSLSHRAFFPTLVRGGPFGRGRLINQGNVLCSRFPLCGAQQHALPGGGEARFLCEARIRLGGAPARLFVTHLSLKRSRRAKQIRRVAARVAACDEPAILAGDFNTGAAGELRPLTTRGPLARAGGTGATFPSWAPARAVDHLFFSRHFEIVRSCTFDRFRFSDHLPLVADVRLVR